ncbi:MAG: YqgE/AlgH family protein [Burkholderiales bacterium]|nr:YqgE/AlgH family protein [Burkholderiales bacterium]
MPSSRLPRAPVTAQASNFTNHFLIAMPSLGESVFGKTVTFVCEHNDQGALGIVVNRPLDIKLETLFEQVDIKLEIESMRASPVYFGGPVQTDRGFVLHRPLGGWSSTLKVTEEIGLTTSKDILQAVGTGEGPGDIIMSLGYAGWSAGQLETEVAQNAWLTVAADPQIMFSLPVEQRLEAAMGLIGANFANLMDTAGHA